MKIKYTCKDISNRYLENNYWAVQNISPKGFERLMNLLEKKGFYWSNGDSPNRFTPSGSNITVYSGFKKLTYCNNITVINKKYNILKEL